METILYTKFPDFEQTGFDTGKYFKSYYKFNVIVYASSGYIKYPENSGSPLSIKYVFKGEEFYLSGKKKYKVTNDRFLVFNERHRYGSYIDSYESTESLSVFFMPEFACEVLESLITPEDKLLENAGWKKQILQPVYFIEKFYPANNYIIPVFYSLRSAIKEGNLSESYYTEQLSLLLNLLINANRELYKDISRVSSARMPTKIEIYRRLSTAKDYIESCFSEKIKLEDLASASGMCLHHLLREFKKYYGKTPYRYITELRLNYAKKLLGETSRSITEISQDAGYEYLSSFSESFYRKFRISPKVFRKKVNLE